MNWQEKFDVFLDLARKMNKTFSVIPLLYGSMGLYLRLPGDFEPDDIDVLVPQYLYRPGERWADLIAFMQQEGFFLVDDREHMFFRDGLEVNFGVMDGTGGIPSLEEFVAFDIRDIPVQETEGAVYKLMTLEQYAQVYARSRQDSYRADKCGNKDQGKIDRIEKALTRPEHP